MKHPNSRALYDYWNHLRQSRPAPLRSELDPRAIKELLPNVFILQHDSDTAYTYRLAGTDLCHHFGCELRNENFLSNWRKNERQSITSLFKSIVEEHAAAVLGVKARDEATACNLMEYLFVPVRLDATDDTRILGCGSVFNPQPRALRSKIIRQEVSGLRILWPENVAQFKVASAPAQAFNTQNEILPPPHKSAEKRGHLWVIEGGVT